MGRLATFIVVQNDLKATNNYQLTDKYDDTVLDLSASTTTITVKFRARGASASLFDASATKVIANMGIISWDWPADSLDVDDGRYEAEVTVDWNGSPQTALDIEPIRVKSEFGAVA